MITIEEFTPSAASPRMVDFGFVQESIGGGLTRIDRPGNRWEIDVSFPPMHPDDARVLVRRLTRAASEGLRMDYPLPGAPQGFPGSPVVNGTDSAGRTLKLRGLTVGYAVREGYWLSLTDGAGVGYLHMVAATVIASGTGTATLTLDPPLRILPADGDAVELAAPKIEGLVTSGVGWELAPDQLTRGLGFTLREAQ